MHLLQWNRLPELQEEMEVESSPMIGVLKEMVNIQLLAKPEFLLCAIRLKSAIKTRSNRQHVQLRICVQ
jgi:hypothetical protein